jgi:hypothetical protein
MIDVLEHCLETRKVQVESTSERIINTNNIFNMVESIKVSIKTNVYTSIVTTI